MYGYLNYSRWVKTTNSWKFLFKVRNLVIRYQLYTLLMPLSSKQMK